MGVLDRDRDPELSFSYDESEDTREYDYALEDDDWYFENVAFTQINPFSMSADSGSIWMKDCRYYGGFAFSPASSFNALNTTFRDIPMLLRSIAKGAKEMILIKHTSLRKRPR